MKSNLSSPTLVFVTAVMLFGLVVWPSSLFSQTKEVLIVGAGISGAAAAKELRSSGFSVTVLEARDRIGGRTWTNTELGVAVDLGASWIHGETNNPLTSLAQEAGVTTFADTLRYPLLNRRGRILRGAEVRRPRRLFRQLLRRALIRGNAASVDRSIGRYLNPLILQQKRSGDLEKGDLPMLRYFSDLSFADEYAIDARYISSYHGYEGEEFDGDELLFPGGYGQLVEFLLRDVTVRLNEVVSDISYSDTGVVVTTSQDTYEADYVVVTVPLGVLKRGAITFSPELPQSKSDAIENLDMGVLNKVALQFPSAFWEERYGVIGGFANTRRRRGARKEVAEFSSLHQLNGSPVLVTLFGGDFSIASEDLSDTQVVDSVMTVLRRIFGQSIPAPIQTLRTRWLNDPYSYGSYSYIPVGGTADDRVALSQPINNRVFFAGEATHVDYPSTVHGAYLTGIREAERISAIQG